MLVPLFPSLSWPPNGNRDWTPVLPQEAAAGSRPVRDRQRSCTMPLSVLEGLHDEVMASSPLLLPTHLPSIHPSSGDEHDCLLTASHTWPPAREAVFTLERAARGKGRSSWQKEVCQERNRSGEATPAEKRAAGALDHHRTAPPGPAHPGAGGGALLLAAPPLVGGGHNNTRVKGSRDPARLTVGHYRTFADAWRRCSRPGQEEVRGHPHTGGCQRSSLSCIAPLQRTRRVPTHTAHALGVHIPSHPQLSLVVRVAVALEWG